MPTSPANSPRRTSLGSLALVAVVTALGLIAMLSIAADRKGVDGGTVRFVTDALLNHSGTTGALMVVWLIVVGVLARSIPRSLPSVVLGSATLFVLIRAALHVLHPEIDPLRDPMSVYAQEDHGYLMPPTFGLSGGMFLSAVLCLVANTDRTILKCTTLSMLGVILASLLLVGVLPADPGQTLQSTPEDLSVEGMVHQTAGMLAFPLTIVLPWLLIIQAWPAWQPSARRLLVIGGAPLPLIPFAGIASPDYLGLFQRLYLLMGFVWFTLACLLLRPKPTIDDAA